MEGDHASPEPPERAISGGARSYDCIFCKRGFSNAQALGGHMNIHRKDKARLKQQPTYDIDDRISSSSVSIKNSVVSSYSLSTRSFSTSRVLSHGDHIGASTLPFKWPWIAAPREQDIQEEVRRGGEDKETCTHSNNRQEGGEPEVMELDLELRLGPEPPRASMTSLKEFL